MQYLNTEYGREGREQSRGQPEQIEKMIFWINKKRVVVAVKRTSKGWRQARRCG
jgi:hypothetical protein